MEMDQAVWVLFWLLLPAYGYVAFMWIAPLWRKHRNNCASPIPWHQLFVAAGYFLLLLAQTHPGFLHSRTSNALLLALNVCIFWLVAIRISRNWWKQRNQPK